jgi:hypothetical protein
VGCGLTLSPVLSPPLLSQLPEFHTNSCDNISQFSVDSITSLDSKEPIFIAAGDIRYRGIAGRELAWVV